MIDPKMRAFAALSWALHAGDDIVARRALADDVQRAVDQVRYDGSVNEKPDGGESNIT